MEAKEEAGRGAVMTYEGQEEKSVAKDILLEIRETYMEPPCDIEDEQRAEGIQNHFRDALEKLPKEIQNGLSDSMERDKSYGQIWCMAVLNPAALLPVSFSSTPSTNLTSAITSAR